MSFLLSLRLAVYPLVDFLVGYTLLGLFALQIHVVSRCTPASCPALVGFIDGGIGLLFGLLIAWLIYPFTIDLMLTLASKITSLLCSPSSSTSSLTSSASSTPLASSAPILSTTFDFPVRNGQVPLVYHSKYNITAFGMENLHPFDSVKYGRVFAKLLADGVIKEGEHISPPRPASREELLSVHTAKYLSLLNCTSYVARLVELPPVAVLPSCVLRALLLNPMLLATKGSIMAAELSLAYGWAINLSGGYHHASCNCGGGFCVFADITIAVKHLRNKYPNRVQRVTIIDLDAHQGNGHERDFTGDKNTCILDVYNPRIYPGDIPAKQGITVDVHVTGRDTDETYLQKLAQALPKALGDINGRGSGGGGSGGGFRPDFVLYNVGTDCMENDPLGGLNISPQGIVNRDEMVFRACFERNIPIAMVLSGGYQKSNAPCIANSIANLERSFGILSKARARSVTSSGYSSTSSSSSSSSSSAYHSHNV